MDRHKMLMGVKRETKTPKITHRKSIRKDRRTVATFDLGLDGGNLEDIINTLRQLEVSEKQKGHFTIKLTMINEGDYDEYDPRIEIYTERYETEAEIDKRLAAERKREEAKKKRAEKIKSPQHQKSLIDKMNKNVSTRMGW